jgi:hypothetical protein
LVKNVFDILVALDTVILLLTFSELPRHQSDIVGLRPMRRRIILREPRGSGLDVVNQVWSVRRIQVVVGRVLTND